MSRKDSDMDESMNQLSSINAIMQAQLEALAAIEEILLSEREALRDREPDRLLHTANLKNDALARLDRLEDRRRSMTPDLDDSQPETLRALTQRCRTMNLENAALLNAQQQHVNRLLRLLRGNADQEPASYDASGRTNNAGIAQLRLTQA